MSELRVAIWAAITFGAVLASYSAFRPVRDSLMLEGDPDKIPWLFVGTFIAVSCVSPLWSALVGRGRNTGRVIALAYHAFAACMIGFAIVVAIAVAPIAVGRVFYIWSAVFNLFAVSVFWSLLADLTGPRTAARLYGPIAAGGTLGSLLGPVLTKLLVGTIGIPGVLVMSAVLLELAVVGVGFVRRAASELPEPPARTEPEARGGAFSGIAHVVRSPYLGAIVGYVLCTAAIATYLYLTQAHIVADAKLDKIARTDYFASIDTWLAIVTLVLQLAVAPFAIRWLGPGIVLAVLPLVQAAGMSLLAGSPTLATLFYVQVAGRAATHGLTRPARELLFTVVSRGDKYRAKNAIDLIAYRFGDVSSSWGYQGLAAVASGTAMLAVTLPFVAVWLACAAVLGIGFRRRSQHDRPS